MGRPKKDKPTRSDGRYEVKVTIGKSLDGTLIRKSFMSTISTADARRKGEEYKIQYLANQIAGAPPIQEEVKKTTFEAWANEWLNTYKKGTVKEHTYLFTYKSNLDKYLIPYFKDKDMPDIKQVDIQTFFNSNNHLAKSTLNKHKIILQDIFERAMLNDICIKNPVKGVKITTAQHKKERSYWTNAELDLALKYALMRSDAISIGIVLMLTLGLRRSEALALMWSDVDFEKNLIHIQRSLVPTTGKLILGQTKSESSNRIIPINKTLINYLNGLEKTSLYIISNDKGAMLSPNTFASSFKKYMDRLCEATGLQSLTPHELRHSFGTSLREQGVDIYTIQKIMGHADIGVTADVYIHNDLDVLRKNFLFSDSKEADSADTSADTLPTKR